MTTHDFFCLATYSVKPTKMEAFRAYLHDHLEVVGAEHVATFTPVVGREGVGAVMCLLKINDLNDWFRGRAKEKFTAELDEYCTNLEYTLMDKCDYSSLEYYYQDGEADSRDGLSFYFWADIEVKANRMQEYHDYWSHNCVQGHVDAGGQVVATFNIISGENGTTRVKRLFKITNLEDWAEGEVSYHNHSNRWDYLAYQVWTTEMYPEPYSHLR